MTVRDILVLVDNAASAARQTAAAAAVAARCNGRLTGLFASGYPASSGYGDVAGWMRLVEVYLAAQRAEAGAAEAAFRAALAPGRLAGEWLYRETDPTATTVALAALYDIVVIGQPDPEAAPGSGLGLRPEEVVLGAGCPALVVPYAGGFTEIGRRVLVAWNATREAARALHDAMFILERAESVTVLEIEPLAVAAGETRVSATDLAAALGRRGVKATAENMTAGDISVEDLLLSRAADLAADLLVMGAYGHSRLREFVLGGVSRGIFRHMTLPVLMAH